jgi:hypothetical protein
MRILAELQVELGEARVGKLDQVDTWQLEARSALIPFREKTQRKGRLMPVEPSQWVQNATCVEAPELVRHLLRLEQVCWWKSTQTLRRDSSNAQSRPASTHGTQTSSDVFLAWNEGVFCVVKKAHGRIQRLGDVD